MFTNRYPFGFFVFGVWVFLLAPTAYAGTELIGVYKDWTAQTYTQNGVSVCMMWSQPEKAEGDYTSRGEI